MDLREACPRPQPANLGPRHQVFEPSLAVLCIVYPWMISVTVPK